MLALAAPARRRIRETRRELSAHAFMSRLRAEVYLARRAVAVNTAIPDMSGMHGVPDRRLLRGPWSADRITGGYPPRRPGVSRAPGRHGGAGGNHFPVSPPAPGGAATQVVPLV